MTIQTVMDIIRNGDLDEKLCDIYVDRARIEGEKTRYLKVLQTFKDIYGDGECEIYSAPGRTEVGGNHTDHQNGEVLAAAINNDAIAVVRRTDDNIIDIKSGSFPRSIIQTSEINKIMSEEGTTCALIRGVAAGVCREGYRIGGLKAYVDSEVLIGAGLSSSAAFESLLGTVFSYIYNGAGIDAVTVAKIGQYAENVYFGKPCGLLDQMACSVGNLVHIDFENPASPFVEKIDFDLDSHRYSLVITDTKGSHSDLTDEYAAVPAEMCAAARVFGKEHLREVSEKELIDGINKVRNAAGDRAALRAIHFMRENKRVQLEVAALKNDDIESFLQAVTSSGNSSFKYLQNVYSSRDTAHQNVSLALALSEAVIGNAGACRVHGGGFAGTIQAFVHNDTLPAYRRAMDNVFGKNSAAVLKFRKYGGIKVI